jgi:hypothetical protein
MHCTLLWNGKVSMGRQLMGNHENIFLHVLHYYLFFKPYVDGTSESWMEKKIAYS